MHYKDKKSRSIHSIANDFFHHLGEYLPYHCASDEFYFFPRAEDAVRYLDTLDDLHPEKIKDHIQNGKNLLGELSNKNPDDLESEIDCVLLRQSIQNFVREFGDREVWKTDPMLYIKIPLFAMDYLFSRNRETGNHLKEGLHNIISQIPPYLRLAIKNLCSPPEISLQVAHGMMLSAIQFHNEDVSTFIEERIGGDRGLLAVNRRALEAWEEFDKALTRLPCRKAFAVGEEGLREILDAGLNLNKSPDEVLEIAHEEYQKTRVKIIKLEKKMNGTKNGTSPAGKKPVSSPEEIIRLYEREVKNLREFFYSQNVMTLPASDKLTFLQTPSYLQSLRVTSSYRAPVTGDKKDRGIFYFTPAKEDLELVASHCAHLVAHETYPGHHVLDHLRIHHSNPVRRQIESPLFYEGWASYSERLLNELGYVWEPYQQLIGLKRQLWRNLRAVLDVKLQTESITPEQAVKEIEALGFSLRRARRQVNRFAISPGYQLCYTTGEHEILKLRKRFSPQFGLKNFHDILLGDGQLPFHLAERIMENSLHCEKK